MPQWEWRTARVQNMASVMGVVTTKGTMQAGTWARLTNLSADHILTWSPELCLTEEVAKLSCGSCLAREGLVRHLRLVTDLAANILITGYF